MRRRPRAALTTITISYKFGDGMERGDRIKDMERQLQNIVLGLLGVRSHGIGVWKLFHLL
jgi:hypothetical protein